MLGKVNMVLDKLKVPEGKEDIVKIYRIGKIDLDGKDASLGSKYIFINLDETPLTRKENARLRGMEENKERKNLY